MNPHGLYWPTRTGAFFAPQEGSQIVPGLEHIPGDAFLVADKSKFALCLLLCSLMLRKSLLGPKVPGSTTNEM
jgi:hypothetical protein